MGIALFAFSHALFIVILVAFFGMQKNIFTNMLLIIISAAILTAPISLFIYLENQGTSYFCADGYGHFQSNVPLWPWLWIGWACIAILALPERTMIFVFGGGFELEPIWSRIAIMLPFMLVLYYLGYFFQVREVDCTPPFDGMGLFEGGMILIPMYLGFIFSLGFSLAMISIFSIKSAY